MRAAIVKNVLLVLFIVAAVALVVWGYETWRTAQVDEGRELGRSEVQGRWDQAVARQAAEALERARAAGRESIRRLDRQQENQRAQDDFMARVRRDAAAGAAERDGLQLQASSYLDAAGCGGRTADSAIECIRAAAAQVGHVLGMCAARHQQLAFDADEARGRGLKCEADYDALRLIPSTTTTERQPQ
jgi:hypothetical protein